MRKCATTMVVVLVNSRIEEVFVFQHSIFRDIAKMNGARTRSFEGPNLGWFSYKFQLKFKMISPVYNSFFTN